jgi:hypothetical protein
MSSPTTSTAKAPLPINRKWRKAIVGFTQWKTALVIVCLAVATYKGWNEAWGILFLFWVFISIRNKEAFLIEKITWSKNPFLFLLITGFWFLAGLMNLIWQGESLTFVGSYLYKFLGWG